MITWHMLPDGLHIWKDGQYIGLIPIGQAGTLIYKIAREMQSK